MVSIKLWETCLFVWLLTAHQHRKDIGAKNGWTQLREVGNDEVAIRGFGKCVSAVYTNGETVETMTMNEHWSNARQWGENRWYHRARLAGCKPSETSSGLGSSGPVPPSSRDDIAVLHGPEAAETRCSIDLNFDDETNNITSDFGWVYEDMTPVRGDFRLLNRVVEDYLTVSPSVIYDLDKFGLLLTVPSGRHQALFRWRVRQIREKYRGLRVRRWGHIPKIGTAIHIMSQAKQCRPWQKPRTSDCRPIITLEITVRANAPMGMLGMHPPPAIPRKLFSQ